MPLPQFRRPTNRAAQEASVVQRPASCSSCSARAAAAAAARGAPQGQTRAAAPHTVTVNRWQARK